ncbi:MAG: GNAT family N-acetyltransferase [Candidatus Eremiobacteraeota bacterium]|nr:GNAT family N-acetyltransferase [Candidatus Eremiobacteraeota bacterium]
MPISRSPLLQVEVVRLHDDRAGTFFQKARREALNTMWGFNVVWHEQTYDVAAIADDEIVGALRMRVAESLGYVEEIMVLPERRRHGIGRRMLETAAEIGSYNNCHKLTVAVPHRSGAQTFFEVCGFREEAVLPQHAWKKDVAVLRKFLL